MEEIGIVLELDEYNQVIYMPVEVLHKEEATQMILFD
jgi:hypothetical protein